MRLLLVLSLFYSFTLKAQSDKKTFTDTLYLYNDTFSGLEKLEPLVNQYDVFINGENHTYLKSNSKLWVKMIKFLHQKAGVRNVLIEYGYSSGYLINQYIQTGDSLLFEVLKAYSFKDLAFAYKDLMEYNRTLPEDEKIYFSGIDLERGLYSACKVLALLIPDGVDLPDSIALHVESLLSLVSYNDIKIFSEDEEATDYFNSYSSNSTIEKIIENFNKHTKDYEFILGKDFGTFQRIIKGLQDVALWNSYEDDNSTHQFIYREKYLYDRFMDEYKVKGGKYFGQFGRCHSLTSIQTENSCNWYNFKSLAHRIKSSKETGKSLKVFSIGIMYNESIEDEGWTNIQDHIDSIFSMVPENSLLLYDLPADSFLRTKFTDMFNFLFFNHFEPSQNYLQGRDDDDDETEAVGNSDELMSMFGTGGVYNFNLNNLNNYFKTIGNQAFNNQFFYAGFGLASFNKKSTSSLSFNYMLKQNIEPNDSLRFKLRGFALHSEYGFNLARKTKHLLLCPSWGIGMSVLTLEVSENTNNPDISKGYLGEDKFSTYYNPAFTTDFSMLIGTHFKHFIGSLWGGYQFDLSNKRWFAEERMRKGPETSTTGWFAGLQLGFTFAE